MIRSILLLALVATAAHAQVKKVVGFSNDHVLLYVVQNSQGAIVKLDEALTPKLVDLNSSEWKNTSRDAKLKSGPAPGDKVPLVVSVKLSSGKGTWTDDSYTWALAPKKKPAADEPQGHALFTVQDITGAGSALALDVPLRALTGKLTTYWDENGSFFAVFVEPVGGPAEVFVGRSDISATTVEILSTADMAGAAQSVADQLWKDGRSVVRIGRALKPREQTVVFAAAANTDQGQAVADSISGGAALQTLTWKSDCQVVVGVGESAQQ